MEWWRARRERSDDSENSPPQSPPPPFIRESKEDRVVGFFTFTVHTRRRIISRAYSAQADAAATLLAASLAVAAFLLYSSRIANAASVCISPVPLFDPGESARLSIACVTSP